MAKTYTGIDIGDHALKVAVSDGASIKLMAVEVVPDGMVANGRIVSFDAMADFIKVLPSKYKGLDKNVAFVIPGESCVTRCIQVPFMTEKALALNLPFEFRDYISQGKDKYTYDYTVLSLEHDEAGKPEKMNLLAVACQKETLTDYTEMFKRAGFRLRLALPPLAALQNLVAQSPQTPDNFCIIDLSHRETQLHFFAHRIYDVTRTLDIGGRDITRAIAEHFGVDEHMADEYKLCNFNGAQQLESVVQVFGSIAVDASRALNFFSFNNPQIVIETAYFFGGNSLIPALVQALAAQIDIPLISIASLMPPYASPDTFHIFCPLAYGATIGG